jgi:hypothetical protein
MSRFGPIEPAAPLAGGIPYDEISGLIDGLMQRGRHRQHGRCRDGAGRHRPSYFRSLRCALRPYQPAEAVIILGTGCVLGAIAGAIVHGEHLSPSSWVGATLIVLSAVLVQLVPSRRDVRRFG